MISKSLMMTIWSFRRRNLPMVCMLGR